MDLRTFVVLALLGVSGTLAAPTDTSRCAGECTQVYNPKFDYSPGKTYTYAYESSTTLKLAGVTSDEPGLKLAANAEISVLTPCEFALKLSNVRLSGPKNLPQAGDFKKIVEERPLLFSFSDGRVNHVCPDPKDPTWSVNLKRGVLSTFQNTMDKNLETFVREVDIAGQCDTQYEVTATTGKSTTVNKRKELATCTKRVGRITSLQGNPYASYSRVQSPPLTKSSQNCVHVIANNLIQSVECEELHVLRLFARGELGATTVSKTKLTYLKQAKGSAKNLPRKVAESSLLFDHSEDVTKLTNDVDETIAVLKNICENTQNGLGPSAATDFTRLVYLVKRLPADSIRRIDANLGSGLCNNNPKAKSTFQSAVNQAGTEGSVQVLVEWLNNKKITGLRARAWITSLAFTQRPNSATIEAVIPLIDSPNPNRNALLSASSIVHTFCRRNDQCEKDKSVQRFIERLGRHLGNKCKANSVEEEDRVIASLKAFGNIGHSGKFLTVIQDCVKDSSLNIPIRLAAIDSFRRASYDENTNRLLLRILEDQTQNTELRIASYLGVMRHPCSDSLQKIKWILDKEIINQVNSFIWTHLKNLQKSKSPVKHDVRRLVKNIALERKYVDGRKFSKNYAASFYSDKLNAGGAVDGNIIFTPESFLPRSASLNVTVDLFGYSIDILEVDVRAVNLEHRWEKYFGPTGKLTGKSDEELQSRLRDRWHKISQGIENEAANKDHSAHRHRREAVQNSAKYKSLVSKAAIKPKTEPEGSLSLKVFGNEIRWYDFHRVEDLYDKEDPYNLKDILNTLATHKELDVAHNAMFLDTTSTIPTASGFPLRLDLNGTASVALKLISHFDVRQFLLSPRHADIKSLIQPSASIELAGSLIIDAGVVKTGLKLASSAYSSTGVDGTLLIKEGEFTAKLDLPKETQDLIKVKSNLYVVDNDKETPVTPVSSTRYELQGCSKRLGSLIGVELCTVISLPRPLVNPQRPFLPLGGSLEYGVSLRKTNPEFQGYHFTAVSSQSSPSSANFKISFNTPGSTKDREYTLEYEVQAGKQLHLKVRTPYKKVDLSGDFNDGGSTREANMVLKIDDSQEYAFHGKTGVVHQGDTVILNPTWEITRPNSPKVVLTGTIKRTPGKKLEFDIRDAPNSESKPYLIKGEFEANNVPNKSELEGEFEFVSPDRQSKWSAEYKREDNENHLTRNIEFNYESQRKLGEKRSFSLKLKRETKYDHTGYKYYRFAEWKVGRLSEYNGRVTVNMEHKTGEWEHLLDGRWGPNFDDVSKSFHLEHRYELNRVSKDAYEGKGKLQLLYPRRNINVDLQTKLNYQVKRLLDYDLTLKYGNDKTVKLSFEYKNQSTRLLKLSGELKLEIPSREIIIRDSVEETGSGEYKGQTYIQWQRGESLTIDSSYKNKGSLGVTHHEVEVVALLNKQQIRKYTALLHSEEKKSQLVLKVVKPDKTYEVNFERLRPDTTQGQMELKVVLPWVEGTAKGKRSPTQLDAAYDFKTERRRVVGSVNIIASPSNTLNFDLQWDADRDANQRVTIVSKLERRGSGSTSLKSIINLPNRVVKADFEVDLPQTLFNGDHHIKTEIEYAPGKNLNIDAKFNIDKNQEARRVSNGVVSINKGLPDGVTIIYNTDYQRLPEERRFNARFDINRAEHNSDLVLEINHVRGDNKIDTNVALTRADSDVGFEIGLIGDWDFGSEDGFIVGAGLEVKTPLEGPLSDFAIVIREGLKRSPSSADFVHENRLRLGKGNDFGVRAEYKRRSPSQTGLEYSATVELNTPFESFSSYQFRYELIVQQGAPFIISAKVEADINDRHFKSVLRYDMIGTKANAYLSLDSSRINGPLELTLSSNTDINRGKHAFEATINLGPGKVIRYVRHMTLSKEYSDIDIEILTPSETTPKIKITAQIRNPSTKQTLITVYADWGKDKYLEASGEVKANDQNDFSGQVKVNSAALSLTDVSVSASGNVIGPKKTLALKFNFGPDRDVDIHASREVKPGNDGSIGELSVKINSEDFLKIKTDLEDGSSRKSPMGRLLALRTEVHNPMLSAAIHFIILSEKGINPTIKICTLDLNKCIIAETLIDRAEDDPKLGPIDSNYYAKVIVQRAPGDTRTVGLIARSNRLRNKVERSVKIAWNEEEKKFIGLDYVSEKTGDANKPGYNRKYQIILPSRTIEARSDKTSNDKGYVYNLNLLLDATREPNRKLSINIDAKVTSSGESMTRISRITVKHPELKNDLLITNELRVNQERVIFAQKTEFDLTGKKVTIDIEILDVNKSPNGFNYTYLLGIRQSAAKNLDLKIRGHRAKTDEGRTFGHELVWLNKDGVPKSYSIFSEVDKVNHVINGAIRTPIRQFDWKGTYDKLEPNGLHGVRADLDFNYNNKLVRRAHIEYSARPSINLKYYSNPADINRMFRLHGGLLDEENFELSATRVKDGQTIEDVSLLVHLNSSRMLFNRLKWRPGILQSIREGIDERSSGLSNAVEEAVQNFAELAKSEVADKSEVLRSTLKNEIVPVLASVGQRLTAMHEELQKDLEPGKLDRLKDVLETLFGNFLDVNSLLANIQEIRQRYRDALSARIARLGEILSRLGGTLDGLVDRLVNALANLPERIQAWRSNARSRLPEMLDRIGSIAEKIHATLSEFLQDKYVSKSIALMREIWDDTVEKAKDWLQTFGFLGSGDHWADDDNLDELYEKIKAQLYKYSEQEGELPKVVKGILTAIRTVKERIRELIEGVYEALREYRDELLSSWSDIYNEYQNNSDFKALVEELRVYREQLREKYLQDDDDDDDKKSFKTQVREVTDKVVLRVRERIAYLIGKDGVYDPANGLIQYYIPLVAPIESLRDLRQGFSLRRLFERDDKQSLKQQLKNALDRLKPQLTQENLREILPPFDGHAVLIGEQHYMTFDGRFYDFSGECSYVLTQDLVDNNFTVIVSNIGDKEGRAKKESVLVISDYHNIVIKPGFKVLLDDQEVELPVQIEKTVVWRKGGTIQVDNNKGFTAVYDVTHNLVSVNVSGFYFGKVGGLLGTFNNEPSDDFRTPEGQNLTNVEQFANSWEVSDHCRSKSNRASHSLAVYGSEPYDSCHKAFTSMWSPLEDCFDTVDSDHFLQVCLEETSPALSAAGGDFCNVIGAYIHTCEHHNIKLKTPEKCLICESPDGIAYDARQKHILKDNNVPRSADVMFIIEQKVCNRPILVESMDELARELDRELQDVNGFRDNRYGVVAFGGEGSHEHAHTHTARGQLFNDARSVVLALKNMAFSGTEPGDAFGAIDLAARYPFRPGVAKIGIMFLCNRCSEKRQSVDYSELQQRLLETGFTLHALIPEEFKMKSKSQLASLIIGIDAQTTYKGKDIGQKNLIGEADLRPHLTGIKDLCFTLAQEVGGSVFRSDLFETRKTNVGKNVKGVFVRRVAANAQPASCQTCSCEDLDFDGVGYPVCRPCMAPKPQTLYGFEDESSEESDTN